MRHRWETPLAVLTGASALVHFVLTAYPVRWEEPLASLFVHAAAVSLFALACWQSLRVRPASAAGLLAAGWGFAFCLNWLAFFGRLERAANAQGEPDFVTPLLGALIVGSGAAFALALWLAWPRAERERAAREETVRRHMLAENAHDFETVMGTFAHPRYELVGTGAVHDGDAEVREYFRASRTAFPDQRNELIALHHVDEGVLAEFWLLGTHRGPLGGLAPTGRAFRCRMAALFVFDARGLVCERVYFDSGTILRQLTA